MAVTTCKRIFSFRYMYLVLIYLCYQFFFNFEIKIGLVLGISILRHGAYIEIHGSPRESDPPSLSVYYSFLSLVASFHIYFITDIKRLEVVILGNFQIDCSERPWEGSA
ncbi:hypothetical protein V8C40DRAFT_242284 [Trichoderma camerunense]